MTNANSRCEGIILDQISGIIVQALNAARIGCETVALNIQDAAFSSAVTQIEQVRQYLTKPEKILGNHLTKHGEIAEQVEVGIRNARQALAQEAMTATFEGVHRTGPVDYLINGVGVQSKFINGISPSLNHVLKHLDTYPKFTDNGSCYIIPKNTYDDILRISNGGHVEGLKSSSEKAIKDLVKKFEEVTGKPFTEAVQPSVVNYRDVQLNTASDTLDREQANLAQQNEQRKGYISDDHKPTIEGAVGAALAGGAVGGTLALATALYAKYKAGKNVFKGDFTTDDWKTIGIDGAKGTTGGAVAAGSIYLMTNYAGMAAPFASAVVSAARGVSSLLERYSKGEITFDAFVDMGMMVCAESAIVGVSTSVGQALIPIPILGAVVGSLAGKMLAEFASSYSAKVVQRLRDEMQAFKAKLDVKLTLVLEAITTEFDRIASLTDAAFSFRLNTPLLGRSVKLAEAYGVHADKIIATEKTLDIFMLA